MQHLKSLFVSAFSSGAVVLSLVSAWIIIQNGFGPTPWWGTLIAAGGVAVFFGWVFTGRHARTPKRLWHVLLAGVLGSLIAGMLGGGWAFVLAVLVGVVGTLLYDLWYSRFNQRDDSVLRSGQALPEAELFDVDGHAHSLHSLSHQPTVWMFYRGNWCPFCMAQIKEVVAQYQELARRGAQVVLVSPQSDAQTRSLAQKFSVPLRFMRDRDNAVAKRLRIFAANGLPTGLQALGYDSDVPLPTVFITNASGVVLYADLSSNYRIRPEPADFLRVLDDHLTA
nr:redoxin domain-containing protein [Oceanococcus sp. HetDA_MAG_MS8]